LKTIIGTLVILCAVFLFPACPVPGNKLAEDPVNDVVIAMNQNPLPARGSIELIEGRAALLGARLSPDGVTGGIHWQSSARDIVELSGFTGPEITVIGQNGGSTIISVMARNSLNEVYAGAECTITVIPSSFFKWDYVYSSGWVDLNPLSNYRSNYIMNTVNEILIRTGETPVSGDTERGGLVLEGAGGRLIIGSGMTTATNSPFSGDPVYDIGGQFDFLDGPSAAYPLWEGRVRISVAYEILDNEAGKSFLRIQVDNNTGEQDDASVINNWLVAELTPDSPRSGTVQGIFDTRDTVLVKTCAASREDVLANSFVCLSLPDGKILIRSIVIESAD